MKNCKPLGIVTQMLIPEYYELIDWNGIWNRKLENGTAFEWAVLASIINVAKENGIEVSIPLVENYNAGEYFILRNEIPLSHGAQAGNSATALSSKNLKYRFLYSLVPKVILTTKGQHYSIFREGCPYHKIMCGQNYLERTDIIIVPGEPSEGYPKLNASENEVCFSYDYKGQPLTGILRIRNSPLIPCKTRSPRQVTKIEPVGIIECSVNKSLEVASEQLARYDAIFKTDNSTPKFSLITGNDLSSIQFDNHCIPLDGEDPEYIYEKLTLAAKKMLSHFSIIVE